MIHKVIETVLFVFFALYRKIGQLKNYAYV